jgi:hypothetical protein
LIEKTIDNKDLYELIGKQQIIIIKLQEAIADLSKELEKKNGTEKEDQG